MSIKPISLTIIVALFFGLPLTAMDGTLDTTFNPAGTPPGTVGTIVGDFTSQAAAVVV